MIFFFFLMGISLWSFNKLKKVNTTICFFVCIFLKEKSLCYGPLDESHGRTTGYNHQNGMNKTKHMISLVPTASKSST